MIYKNLFSQRKKKQEGKREFYEYDKITKETRRKIFYAFERSIKYLPPGEKYSEYTVFERLRIKIIHQYGMDGGISRLTINDIPNQVLDVHTYMLNCKLEEFLDSIQLFFYTYLGLIQGMHPTLAGSAPKGIEKTIRDINDIFQLDGIGYEIIKKDNDFLVIRADSKYLHEEVVKNALTLLENKDFETPLKEFEKAIEKYTRKEYAESITYANSTFESVMKIILDRDTGDATQLIRELMKLEIRDQSFLPPYCESMGDQVKNLLQTLPVTRTEKGMPHGKGKKDTRVDRSYAQFALHLSGTFIVFLIERYEELK